MKHTMTERELKMLHDVQQIVLDANATSQETYLLVQVLTANVLLGIMRDRVVTEDELIKATMVGVRNAMVMLRRIKTAEDKVSENVA
jgi:hypothetical protein